MSLKGRFEEIEKDIIFNRVKARDNYLKTPDMTKKDYEGNVSIIPLTFDTYQDITTWTAKYPEHLPDSVYLTIGLAGETGELCNDIKKQHRNDGGALTPERKKKIMDEAGDVLYYLAALLFSLDISLEEVAKNNQVKLVDRLKNKSILERK